MISSKFATVKVEHQIVPRDGEEKKEDSQKQSDKESEQESEKTDKEEEEEEEKKEEEKDEEEEEDSDKQILELLRNPRTRAITIRQLAEEAGLQIAEKGEDSEKKVTKTFLQDLAEALGNDWKFLAPKIAGPFQKALKAQVAELQEVHAETERSRLRRESERAEQEFNRTHPDAKKYQRRMIQLMEKYPPSAEVDMSEYLEDMYQLSKNRSGNLTDKILKKAQGRVDRNSEERRSSGAPGHSVKIGSEKHLTLKEAITLAAQGKKVED